MKKEEKKVRVSKEQRGWLMEKYADDYAEMLTEDCRDFVRDVAIHGCKGLNQMNGNELLGELACFIEGDVDNVTDMDSDLTPERRAKYPSTEGGYSPAMAKAALVLLVEDSKEAK